MRLRRAVARGCCCFSARFLPRRNSPPPPRRSGRGPMLASVRGRGGPVLSRVAPLPRAPRGGELLLRVEAAGVNPVDYKLPRLVAGRITGMDVSGVVEAVGDESNSGGFTVGDAVWGHTFGGAHAHRAVVRCDVVARKPPWLSHAQAAALPVAYITGLQGLRDAGCLRRGGSVLVIGASGGTGVAAVQLATAMGAAEVVAVCSGKNADLVRSYGATRVVDYTKEDVGEVCEAGHFDVIYDAATGSGAGEKYTARVLPLLRPKTGQYVQINGSAWRWILGLTGTMPKQQHLILTKANRADLEALLALMAPPAGGAEQGTPAIVPLVEEVLLDEHGVKDVFARLKGRHTRGKLVFIMR